jgi:hypothetical protein
MFSEVCGLIQHSQVSVLIDFTPLYCGKLAVICVLPSNTTNFLNTKMHLKCLVLFRPSSGTEVQNLKTGWAWVRSILQFLRSYEFYRCQNTGLFYFLFLTHLFYLLLNHAPLFIRWLKYFGKTALCWTCLKIKLSWWLYIHIYMSTNVLWKPLISRSGFGYSFWRSYISVVITLVLVYVYCLAFFFIISLYIKHAVSCVVLFNPFQSNFSANCIFTSSYLFWAGKSLVDYL